MSAAAVAVEHPGGVAPKRPSKVQRRRGEGAGPTFPGTVQLSVNDFNFHGLFELCCWWRLETNCNVELVCSRQLQFRVVLFEFFVLESLEEGGRIELFLPEGLEQNARSELWCSNSRAKRPV